MEDYDVYFEDLKCGDVVYWQGETPMSEDAVLNEIYQLESKWKTYNASELDIENYVAYSFFIHQLIH